MGSNSSSLPFKGFCSFDGSTDYYSHPVYCSPLIPGLPIPHPYHYNRVDSALKKVQERDLCDRPISFLVLDIIAIIQSTQQRQGQGAHKERDTPQCVGAPFPRANPSLERTPSAHMTLFMDS